jgi:DNA-binding HxlR family transcriptional regulator
MTTKTAAERRQSARLEYDAYLAACPTRQLLDVLTNKWVCLVVSALAGGKKRHSELARAITGVSQKMLTQTLRDLEHDGIVTRTVTPSVPVRVDYELTSLGQDLAPVLRSIKAWAEKNMDRVLAAREQHDLSEPR